MFSIPNINHDTFKNASPPWNQMAAQAAGGQNHEEHHPKG